MATPKQYKILIADDETTITTGLSAILSDEGYEVEVCAECGWNHLRRSYLVGRRVAG